MADPNRSSMSPAPTEDRSAPPRVLDGVDLDVAPGRVRLAARPVGLRQDHACCASSPGCSRADAARSRLDGEDITRRPPHRRDVGVVFQNYALFPHLTVAENVAFGLEGAAARRGRDRARRSRAFSSSCI